MEGKLPEPQLSNLTEEPLSGKTEGPLPQVTVPEVSERLEHPVWPVYLQRRYPSQAELEEEPRRAPILIDFFPQR